MILQLGSTGQHVIDLQNLLITAGFLQGPPDGDFGPLTKDAVESFQLARGLQNDGIVGPATIAALIPQTAASAVLGTSAANMDLLWASVAKTSGLAGVAEAYTIEHNMARYAIVAAQFSPMPAYVVGIIHSMEASSNFNTHLANGDPLFSPNGTPLKTTHVPSGLGPFKTWEEGAMAALTHEGWKANMDWDIGNLLMRVRAYNGTAYETLHHINTPYLWSGTNQYKSGKYVSDGVYSSTAVSQQDGAVSIMLALKDRGFAVG